MTGVITSDSKMNLSNIKDSRGSYSCILGTQA